MTRNWHITFDPLHLVDVKGDLDKLEGEAKEQGEDIIQAKGPGGTVLDLGWYRKLYRVVLIKNSEWDKPVETRESKTLRQAIEDFRGLLE